MPDLPFAENPLRTRSDVQRLVRDLIEPIVPHFSEGRAQMKLGENRGHFGDPAGWLEGFSRPLWGIAPLVAGGGAFDHAELWRSGIAAGTNPSHPEYWGMPGDFDQRSVEQAAIGLALALAPETFWQPLSPEVREQLSVWLRRINEVKLVQSNWLLFRVIVNLGLARCGLPWSSDQVDQDLNGIDQLYLGDGWYSDGAGGPPFRGGRLGDYYVPMAFHFYALIYARLASDRDPVRAARYVERSRFLAKDYIHWFSAEGSALPFGRSLTYRFAQGAFWGALAFAGVEAQPWAVMKGLYLRHLRWWLRQPVFSETGLLTIGYTYPNLLMAESYNSSGSPYWALKFFLPLALPETHPFWKADEAPLPKRRAVHTVPGAKLILVTDLRSGDVGALNPGQPVLDWPRNAPHKYSKCAYSTRFGFNVPAGPATLGEGGLDNGISFSDDSRFFRVREQCLEPEVRAGVAYSRWQPWTDVEVRTWLVAAETCHLRIHRIVTARKLWVIEGGFPVGYLRRSTLQMRTDAGEGAVVRSPRGASALRSLFGERTSETAELGPNSSIVVSLTALPLLRAVLEPAAGEQWFACIVGGSADQEDTFNVFSEFGVEVAGGQCKIRRGGAEWWNMTEMGCGTSAKKRLTELETLV